MTTPHARGHARIWRSHHDEHKPNRDPRGGARALRQRRKAGPKSVVFQCDWGTEERHHPVAIVYRSAAEALYDRRRSLDEAGELFVASAWLVYALGTWSAAADTSDPLRQERGTATTDR